MMKPLLWNKILQSYQVEWSFKPKGSATLTTKSTPDWTFNSKVLQTLKISAHSVVNAVICQPNDLVS